MVIRNRFICLFFCKFVALMSPNNNLNIDLDNAEFLSALNLLQNTNRSVFLTGKAGTGKSTFLKYVCAHTKKRHVVLAPTGIAAVNVGGMTLHSFFKIPFKPLLPGDPDYSNARIKKTMRYSREKIKLLKELELIIIDEISMVRCDIIDFIDRVLRFFSGNNREPFGGKQLLFVGDVFQLEPVIKSDMAEILKREYRQLFFFNAHTFDELGLIPIELKKVYRQTNAPFIAMLDRIRVGHPTREDMAALDSRVNPHIDERDNSSFTITLATRRDTVDSINEAHMSALDTAEHTFEGVIEGTFADNDLPTNKELIIKQGAQVIFIRNDADGRWVNGTLGHVSAVDDENIEVTLEDGSSHKIEPETWENIQYSYDEKEKKVIDKLLGTFKQFPIKPAWALTVHKSQGLTFNRVVIDFTGGAFAGGQAYVALSRCTSLEGITIVHRMGERDIFVNPAIIDFSRQFNDRHAIDRALTRAKALGLYSQAVRALDQDRFAEAVDHFAEAMKLHNVVGEPYFKRFVTSKLNRFKRLKDSLKERDDIIAKQDDTLRQLALEFTALGDNALNRGQLVSEPEMTYSGHSYSSLDPITIKSAMANYDKALRIYPQCIEAMTGKAHLLVAVGEDKMAQDALRMALKINPKCFDALMALAALRENHNDIAAAVKTLKRAARHHRKRPEPHEALAAIYEKVGLDDLADEHADIARRLRER